MNEWEDFLLHVLIQLAVIIAAARTGAWLLGKLGQPQVVGEMAAMIGKMGGCGLAGRACGLSWRESGCIAVMMNTRALMGLIAINVGRELNVVPDSVFSMLVIMALATTLITTPVLRRLITDEMR